GHLYKAHSGVISGLARDHMKVYLCFYICKHQFSRFTDTSQGDGSLLYCEEDSMLTDLIDEHHNHTRLEFLLNKALETKVKEGVTYLKLDEGDLKINVFRHHYLMNLNAAKFICNELNVSDKEFFEAISSFKGANKRLEKIAENWDTIIFRDFAHSPSKLTATIERSEERRVGQE